jgi:hypothetical protein
MRNAQLLQIGRKFGCIVECEAGMHLKPVTRQNGPRHNQVSAQGSDSMPLRVCMRRELPAGVGYCDDSENFDFFNMPRCAGHMRHRYAALDVC